MAYINSLLHTKACYEAGKKLAKEGKYISCITRKDFPLFDDLPLVGLIFITIVLGSITGGIWWLIFNT